MTFMIKYLIAILFMILFKLHIETNFVVLNNLIFNINVFTK